MILTDAPQPLALTIPAFRKACGNISHSHYYQCVKKGLLPPPRKLGNRSVILWQEAQDAVRRLAIFNDGGSHAA